MGGGASEVCVHSGSTTTGASDLDDPDAGSGFYYLLRAVNVCAVGSYGFDSVPDERTSSACP